jgi:hypothetical protein
MFAVATDTEAITALFQLQAMAEAENLLLPELDCIDSAGVIDVLLKVARHWRHRQPPDLIDAFDRLAQGAARHEASLEADGDLARGLAVSIHPPLITVHHPHLPTVRILRESHGFRLTGGHESPRIFSPLAHDGLMQDVIDRLFPLLAPELPVTFAVLQQLDALYRVHHLALKEFRHRRRDELGGALSQGLLPAWMDLQSGFRPPILALDRHIRDTSGHHAAVIALPELWEHPHLLRDLYRYPAAAAAAVILSDRIHAADLTATPACVVRQLGDWQSLFCPLRTRPTGPLRRLLSNLPAGWVDPAELGMLRFAPLLRVPRTRDGLRILLMSRRMMAAPMQERCERVGDDDAIAAVDLIARGMPDLDAAGWRTRDHALHAVLDVLLCGDRPWRGSLQAAARRCLATPPHLRPPRGRAGGRRDPPVPDDARLPDLPIALPPDPRVRALTTAGALREEGRRMRHCVAAYVAKAYRGASFFFHVACDGNEATVELDGGGTVVQTSGPCNGWNPACAWAEAWFPEQVGRSRS